MIKKILEEKYGKEILNNLLTDGRINLENEAYKSTKTQLVNAQMNKMINLDLLSQEDYENGMPWAFDVSSTYADLNKVTEIPVMIIGEDPHVQNNDYQAVYSFAQKGNHFRKEDINDKFKKFLIRLFHSESKIAKLTTSELQLFLSSFYITDLCHFTPQGLNNRKEELKNWNQIKTKTARFFLKKEIDAINPKYIITHGGASRIFLSKLLEVKLLEAGKVGNKFYLGNYNNIKIVGITHIGSKYTTGHWNKFIDETREKIIEKYIQI